MSCAIGVACEHCALVAVDRGFRELAVAVTSDCDLLGLLLRGLNHVPSSCLAEGTQLPAERLGAMFSLCRQAAWRHRLFREDMWRSCQAAWQGRWLHLAVKLLGGRVRVVSWCRLSRDCKGSGSGLGLIITRSSSCLAAGYIRDVVVRLIGGIYASSRCVQ